MRALSAFVIGAVFGVGLLISGMTDTTRVRGWLDLFGNWDPTLAFVMGGAILPMAAAWAWSRGRRPLLGGTFPPPSREGINRDLALGSVLFGAGWGLSGLCPGPAMASLGWGGSGGVVFILAMLAGMAAMPALRARLDALAPPA